MREAAPVVLGVWDGHDASVAIVADGALVFALSEERPSRRKRYSGFPGAALAAALTWAESRSLAITDVALAGQWGRMPLRLLEPFYSRSDPARDELAWTSALVREWENRVARTRGLRSLERSLGLALPRIRLRGAFGRPVRFHTVPHHEAHAWSALFGVHDESDLVVTWDAYGEGLSATARLAGAPERTVASVGAEPGLARLYGAVTQALGFSEGDEGKVMGRAARGDAGEAVERFRALVEVRQGWPHFVRPLSRRTLHELVDGLSVEDVAAGLQELTEEGASAWVSGLLRQNPKVGRLLVAGGLFSNIRVNQRLSELPGVSGLFVFPNMLDGGLSAGAAACAWTQLTGAETRSLESAALGAVPLERSIVQAIEVSGLAAQRVEAPEKRAAEHLQEGRVVCWYEGRDEFGPRALGQRSVLFAADRSYLADRVNGALGRDPLMPFGPLLRQEDLAEFTATRLSAADLAWMTIAVEARPELAELCPVAVHCDGTTRPQVLSADRSPTMYRVLSEYQERTGKPVLVNTSFNLHGEPIVHSPHDAVQTFRTAGFDVLFLGDRELHREGGLA